MDINGLYCRRSDDAKGGEWQGYIYYTVCVWYLYGYLLPGGSPSSALVLTPPCDFTVGWLSPAVKAHCQSFLKFLPVTTPLRHGINLLLLPLHPCASSPLLFLSPFGLLRLTQSHLSLPTAASKSRCLSVSLATLTRSASRKSALRLESQSLKHFVPAHAVSRL